MMTQLTAAAPDREARVAEDRGDNVRVPLCFVFDSDASIRVGCDYGQGFLLGQPMPEDRFVSLLRQHAASQSRQISAGRGMDAQTADKRRG